MKRWGRFSVVPVAAALALLALAPVATAANHGVDRPFTATLAGPVHWEFPGTSPSDCQVVTTMTRATGEATHLGRVVAFMSHCPSEPAYVMDGRLTLIAADGDKLYGVYNYDPFAPEGVDGVTSITLDGGTGRFAEASGTLGITYDAVAQLIPGCTDPNDFACLDFSIPWPWTATLSGTITY